MHLEQIEMTLIDPTQCPDLLVRHRVYKDWKLKNWRQLPKKSRNAIAAEMLENAFEDNKPLAEIREMFIPAYHFSSNWDIKGFMLKYAPQLENEYTYWLGKQPREFRISNATKNVEIDKKRDRLSEKLTKSGMRYDTCYN